MVASPDQFASQYEDIWIRTPDHELLHGWRIFPKGVPIGTVLHLHGNAENISTHFRFVGWLAELGYEVIVFDYRGYGRSSGFPNRSGAVKDGIAAISWSSKRSKDLFVIAQSLGGAIAVPAVSKQAPANLRLLVLDSTFASYRHIAREKLGEIWLTWPLQWPLSFTVTDHLAPKSYAASIHQPTIVVHGDRDRIVPEIHGRQLFGLIGSQQKQFWLVKDSGHVAAFNQRGSTYKPLLAQEMCKRSSLPTLCGKHLKAWRDSLQEK